MSADSHKGLKIYIINVCLKVMAKIQIKFIKNFIQYYEWYLKSQQAFCIELSIVEI